MKRTPLRRGTTPLKRTPISKVSARRRKENRERTKVLAALRAKYPMCQRCGVNKSTDGHELLRRSAAGSITDPDNIRMLCRPCHDWVGANPQDAIATGWAVSRYRRNHDHDEQS